MIEFIKLFLIFVNTYLKLKEDRAMLRREQKSEDDHFVELLRVNIAKLRQNTMVDNEKVQEAENLIDSMYSSDHLQSNDSKQ